MSEHTILPESWSGIGPIPEGHVRVTVEGREDGKVTTMDLPWERIDEPGVLRRLAEARIEL